MAADLTSVFNRALSAVGTRYMVSDPDEASSEAEICRLWYEEARDQVLRAAPWPSAQSAKRLTLLRERDNDELWTTSDPSPNWQYAYAVPNDMLYPRHLGTYGRFQLATIPADNRLAIMTMEASPVMVYTRKQEDVGLWDVDLRLAITYALAAHIAMPLHGKADRAKLAQIMANELIMTARVNAANANVGSFETVPDWLSARGYAGSGPQGRYLYEYGSLIAVMNDVG